MPRHAKAAKEGKTHKLADHVPAEGINAGAKSEGATPSNGYGVGLKQFLGRYEALQDDIDAILSAAKDECEPARQDQAQIVKDAADAGYSKKEFKTVLRKHRLEKRLARVADSLDANQKETYEQMLHALGELADTPLGAAALKEKEEPAAPPPVTGKEAASGEKLH